MKISVLISLLLILFDGFTQNVDTNQLKIKLSGFVDIFYAYDFNAQRFSHKRLPFLYNHNRHNEVNLNFGFLKAAVDNKHYRANLAFHAGTYVNDNYTDEPGVLKNIFEANVGIALNKKANLWLDAGIFSSHIGFESAISIENLTLTRSLVAENSPYFLSGIKLNYSASEKLNINFLIINGWQHIQRPILNNTLPSIGTQLKYKLNDNFTFNWSTFIGNEYPDYIRKMRYFNNLYAIINSSKSFVLISGFDFGAEQKDFTSSNYNLWYSPVIIGRIKTSSKTALALRAEYYQDKNHVIIQPLSTNGFSLLGYSVNFDYSPLQNVSFRIEGRSFSSDAAIFNVADSNKRLNNNYFMVTSIAAKF